MKKDSLQPDLLPRRPLSERKGARTVCSKDLLDPIQVISLGAGVQSSVMSLMAARGLITPMPVAAIFADTQDEPAAVYKWLDWLEKQLPFPVIKTSCGKLSELATRVRTSRKSGQNYLKPGIPAYTLYDDHRKPGKMQRQCSLTVKIELIRREAKKLAGKGRKAVTWIGISTDEPERIKDSQDSRIIHRWPLLEDGVMMNRQMCLDWAKANNLPQPPRSACIYCPFHSDEEWLRIRSESEAEFQFAVDFERRLQAASKQCSRLDSVPYLHTSRVPLDKVKFDAKRQPTKHQEPCQGICGV